MACATFRASTPATTVEAGCNFIRLDSREAGLKLDLVGCAVSIDCDHSPAGACGHLLAFIRHNGAENANEVEIRKGTLRRDVEMTGKDWRVHDVPFPSPGRSRYGMYSEMCK